MRASLARCSNSSSALTCMIETIQMAIDGAVQFAQRKRPRVLSSKGTGQAGLKPNANFVGVRLGVAGKPERVFMGDVQVA